MKIEEKKKTRDEKFLPTNLFHDRQKQKIVTTTT
jgi:hypothetical protein